MIMLILLHIVIATISIICATYTIFRSTRRNLLINYGFISGTVLSGVALLVVSPVDTLRTCIVGSVFLIVVSCMTVIASRNYKKANLV